MVEDELQLLFLPSLLPNAGITGVCLVYVVLGTERMALCMMCKRPAKLSTWLACVSFLLIFSLLCPLRPQKQRVSFN